MVSVNLLSFGSHCSLRLPEPQGCADSAPAESCAAAAYGWDAVLVLRTRSSGIG